MATLRLRTEDLAGIALAAAAHVALLGWLVLDEHLTVAQWIGTVVILAGVLMVSWPRAAPAEKPVPAPATEAPQ